MIIERDEIQRHRLKVSLAAILISLGFVSITLYMGSTLFYPVLQFSEFMGLALHDGIQEVLFGRYVGYVYLMVFGTVSVVVGNLLWYTKKEVDNTLLAMISMPLITTFVILMLKTVQ